VCAARLAQTGHDVVLFERADALGAVGAGILIQPTGQRVLADLGVADAFSSISAPVERLLGTNHRNRVVLDLHYRDLHSAAVGRGVHRAALAEVLARAVNAGGVDVQFGIEIIRFEEHTNGIVLTDSEGNHHGAFDLAVAANGARSKLRQQSGLVKRDRAYPWGALWFVGSDHDGALSGTLRQVYHSTQSMIGFLPTGVIAPGSEPLVSMFWSLKTVQWTGPADFDVRAWKERAIRLAPFAECFLAQITTADQLIFAAYADVVLHRSSVGRIVFVGDAAHAMSPQLGQGANLGMMDGWALAESIDSHSSLEVALRSFERARRRHIWLYQFASRWLTPVFQSDWPLVGGVRDLLLGPACRFGPTRRLGLEMLAGVKAGPFRRLPGYFDDH